MIGYDFVATSRAFSDTAEVKADLRAYREGRIERDKAIDDRLSAIQQQIDRRFESSDKRLDKIADAINNAKK